MAEKQPLATSKTKSPLATERLMKKPLAAYGFLNRFPILPAMQNQGGCLRKFPAF